MLGYVQAPGGRWTGEYIVAPLTEFANGYDFRVGKRIKTERVTKIDFDPNNYNFPCKASYDQQNGTTEGCWYLSIMFNSIFTAIQFYKDTWQGRR